MVAQGSAVLAITKSFPVDIIVCMSSDTNFALKILYSNPHTFLDLIVPVLALRMLCPKKIIGTLCAACPFPDSLIDLRPQFWHQ